MILKNNLKFVILLFIISNYSCESDSTSTITDDSSDDNNGPIAFALTTKTINIPQTIDGVIQNRPVIIQTPNEIDSTIDYPIVFAFHGRGGSHTNWVNTLTNFTTSGDFIGIYPQGFLDCWNLGPEPSTADDVEFVNLIIQELQSHCSNCLTVKQYKYIRDKYSANISVSG